MPPSRPPAASALAAPVAPRPAAAIERGMLLMALAMLIVPGIDALAKHLAATVPPGEITWARFLFQTLFTAPLAVLGLRHGVRPRLDLHALRGLLLATATLLFFAALQYLPLADSIALFFVEPLLLTLLSALLLGEPVGWRRLAAVGVGLLGALAVIQPSYAVFGPAALLPLGAALAFAVYLVLTRRLAPIEDAGGMQFYAGVFGLLALSAALAVGAWAAIPVLDPIWPTASEWLLLAALGLIGTAGHLLVVQAFRRAPATVLAPFQYLEIISATLLGLVVFGDFPEPATWLGIAIIVGSGLYVFHRERKVGRGV
jgi:S-adenosylmethionine uptake transporter